MKNRDLTAIARLLSQSLTPFAVRESLLFLKPIRHTLRGVCLDRSGDSRGFYVWVFFQPLCVPASGLYFNLGWRLGGDSQVWKADKAFALDDLRNSIVTQALPFLDPIKSPRDAALAGKLLDPLHDGATQRAVAYAFARAGDTTQSVRELDRFLAMGIGDDRDWVVKQKAQASTLKELLLTDPEGAQRQLQQWEAQTLKAIGLAQNER